MPASPLQLDLFGERNPTPEAKGTPRVVPAFVEPSVAPAPSVATTPMTPPIAITPGALPIATTPGSVERVFLDWSLPALASVADWLVARCASAATIDLRALSVALPTSRASRRLLELLVARADASERPLFPPKLVTAGALPDLVAASPTPIAGTTTRRVVWAEALRAVDDATRARIVAHPPSDDDWAAWTALGKVLDELHTELGKAELSFAGVAALGVTLDEFPDEDRWLAMEIVAQAYLGRLQLLGLADPQRARADALHAMQSRAEGTTRSGEHDAPLEVVLACVTELAPATRRLVDRICAFDGARVSALIFAPESLAARFDAHGCIVAKAWTEATLPIPDESLRFAEGPDDQAAQVVALLADLVASERGAAYAAEDIVLGAPDAEVVPFLVERLEDAGLPARNAAGLPAQQSAPARFLAEAARWVARGELAALAALIRHPDVEQHIAQESDVLSPLDDYNTDHVQQTLAQRALGEPALVQREGAARGPDTLRGEAREVLRVRTVIDAVELLVAPLRGGPRPLAAWAEPFAKVLIALYGGRDLDPSEDDDRLIAGGVAALRAVLRELHGLRVVGLDAGSPAGMELAARADVAAAARIVLDAIAEEVVPPSAEHAAVEVLGWLELPLDDAPALIVTGFVEGRLPGSINADPFLPDRLRAHLGLDDNTQRHARDAYALHAVLASRPYVRLLAGRRDASGTPLAPSRLALTGDADTVARRLLDFYRGDGAPPPLPMSRRLVPGREISAIDVPRPPPPGDTPALTTLSVTAFRDYLACPYRFWLKHVARLQPSTDSAVELDALRFGSLAHLVLSDFGKSGTAHSLSTGEIAQFLDAALDTRAQELFGDGAFPAVRVQVAQLRERLRAFAETQARWAASGKRIIAAELGTGDARSIAAARAAGDAHPATASLLVDGEPFLLRGRIDRVDRDERTGALYLLDYKLSENASTPDQAHRKSGKWVDLQLPLYRHVLRACGSEFQSSELHLGYVSLPRDLRATRVALSEWSSVDLDEADAIAANVVRDVRRGHFWPRASPPPKFADDFADICQDTKLGAAPTTNDDEPSHPGEGNGSEGGEP